MRTAVDHRSRSVHMAPPCDAECDEKRSTAAIGCRLVVLVQHVKRALSVNPPVARPMTELSTHIRVLTDQTSRLKSAVAGYKSSHTHTHTLGGDGTQLLVVSLRGAHVSATRGVENTSAEKCVRQGEISHVTVPLDGIEAAKRRPAMPKNIILRGSDDHGL
jgi:hypothetical protein